MAEVLPLPMQTTITMLHPRPSSADAQKRMYQGQQNNTYRGAVPTYSFNATPNLRTSSLSNSAHGAVGSHRPTVSTSTSSSDASSQPSAKDDSVIGSHPGSLINLSSQVPDLSLSFDPPAKASPDRYRRPAQKRTDSNSAAPRALSPQLGTAAPTAALATPPAQPTQQRPSVDDTVVPKPGQSELAKRYRRRSLNQLETQNIVSPPSVQAGAGAQQGATSTPTTIRPVSFTDDDAQSQTGSTSAKPESKDRATDSARGNIVIPPRNDSKGNAPAKGSSEGAKRLAAPSPLARQASDSDDQPTTAAAAPAKTRTYAAVAQAANAAPSPAAQHLAAVSDKDLNKGMKSRLRRAFSFGSAQELRNATSENTKATHNAQQTRQQHQQQIDDDMDAEQLEIARRQEAAGIGAGIYSGQGGFSGSTDNLSISSTASSASMMLRKMGQKTKKGARSVKGLFRPKSVIGVAAADGPIDVGTSSTVQPTVAQVSMVTVEAERQNVNVNAHPEELTGGGTGFPKLERNSIDAASATAVPELQRGSADGSDSRKSVVGSDKDRAEVLAAVKKGILKRSGTNSPSGSPVVKPNDGGLAPVPQFAESPASSAPTTPRDAPQGRSSSTPNVNGDYFSARMGHAKSMPNTPNGSVRNISFSPRIQFHDVWSSAEYDRRGEIATCNRLTPMLAQQIKEELNTFKMEMEVHELSKPHTHFF